MLLNHVLESWWCSPAEAGLVKRNKLFDCGMIIEQSPQLTATLSRKAKNILYNRKTAERAEI